ncbi:head-tail adaptor protein [Novosphingobium album (ex Liu et al. 2023)]|uniref:Head-tail adaptor protein n=1 Tax=Novosphingobium album (ex Liu et al. 2023) TaxID=3031130 RepID=A0ABT5WPF0_9SPHN|nr:head-tail adaptor protein [Novosphingobium album (ex Liu et al. 2023)]MDE8651886.1 head-tail adaptor protein [Novosphingobium album (ex Liu et al. 2023)]
MTGLAESEPIMTPAGKRFARIAFERATIVRSQLGTKGPKSWARIGTPRFAAVFFGAGSERRAAAVEQAVQVATFNVLADSLTRTITVEDRIIHDGLAWDITGIVPIGQGPREIDFTATASRG